MSLTLRGWRSPSAVRSAASPADRRSLAAGVLLLAFHGWWARRAWRNYRSLPALGSPAQTSEPLVSIIVPARNEAGRIAVLLDSLSRLRYPNRELIVVDDGSSDETGAIAVLAGARVIRIADLPPGWTGKSFACWTGAGVASGDWLLFTDADTIHGPDSLERALCMAINHDAGLVSVLARQRCRSFWEKLLLPYAYALYFAGAGAACRGMVANGQYMLFRRSDYQRIDGHASVRSSVIEDVALARRCRRHRVRVVLVRGEEDLEVRMYQDLQSLWEGFGKNAFRFVAGGGMGGLQTVLAALACGATLPAAVRCRWSPLRAALVLAPAAALLRWERLFGVPARFALLYPLAAATFQLIALDSMRRTLLPGRTVWKARHY